MLTVDITAGASTTVNTERMSQYPVLNFSHRDRRHRRPVRIVTLLIVVSRDGLVRRRKKHGSWTLTGIHVFSGKCSKLSTVQSHSTVSLESSDTVECGDRLAAITFDW